MPGRSARAQGGVLVHRSTTLTEADVNVVNNIPTTSVARSLLDLGEYITARQLERAFDQADSLQVLDGRGIDDQIARNPTRPGATAVRRSGPTSPGPTAESSSRPTGAGRTGRGRPSRPIAGATSG